MPDHATLYGHLVILITQVLGFGYAWLREGRRHRWEQEQRQTMKDIRADIKNGTHI